ncbi:hypothetical protein Vafri_20528, partial [Volvox africanus]
MTNYQRSCVLSKFQNIKKFTDPSARRLNDPSVGRDPADVRAVAFMEYIHELWTQNDIPSRGKGAAQEEGGTQEAPEPAAAKRSSSRLRNTTAG